MKKNQVLGVALAFFIVLLFGCSDGGRRGGKDNHCAGGLITFFQDADSDGFGNALVPEQACTASAGYVADASDCDDGNAAVNPAAAEVCNGIDDNCDLSIDEGVLLTFYQDVDSDGFGNASVSEQACTASAGYVADATDCDDSRNTVHPGAAELCDGLDNDCNLSIDDGLTFSDYYDDVDLDTYGGSFLGSFCSAPAGGVLTSGDCDDGDAAVNPGAAEVCNGIDDNCNLSIDEGVLLTFYQDADSDGFGNASVSEQACAASAGYVADATDCDDSRNTVHPGAAELCDGLDNDCNLSIDDGLTFSDYYDDVDLDTYGGALLGSFCSAPAGGVLTPGDCDDNDASVHPGAAEICDGIDNQCPWDAGYRRVDEGCSPLPGSLALGPGSAYDQVDAEMVGDTVYVALAARAGDTETQVELRTYNLGGASSSVVIGAGLVGTPVSLSVNPVSHVPAVVYRSPANELIYSEVVAGAVYGETITTGGGGGTLKFNNNGVPLVLFNTVSGDVNLMAANRVLTDGHYAWIISVKSYENAVSARLVYDSLNRVSVVIGDLEWNNHPSRAMAAVFGGSYMATVDGSATEGSGLGADITILDGNVPAVTTYNTSRGILRLVRKSGTVWTSEDVDYALGRTSRLLAASASTYILYARGMDELRLAVRSADGSYTIKHVARDIGLYFDLVESGGRFFALFVRDDLLYLAPLDPSALPDVAPDPVRSLTPEEFKMSSGSNHPWLLYCDFGNYAYGSGCGLSSPTRAAVLRADFQDLAAHGVGTVRWFIFGDLRTSITWSSDGVPLGFDACFLSDFRELLVAASETGIETLVVSLFDGAVTSRRPEIFSAANRPALLALCDELFAFIVAQGLPVKVIIEAVNERTYMPIGQAQSRQLVEDICGQAIRANLDCTTGDFLDDALEFSSSSSNVTLIEIHDYSGAVLFPNARAFGRKAAFVGETTPYNLTEKLDSGYQSEVPVLFWSYKADWASEFKARMDDFLGWTAP